MSDHSVPQQRVGRYLRSDTPVIIDLSDDNKISYKHWAGFQRLREGYDIKAPDTVSGVREPDLTVCDALKSQNPEKLRKVLADGADPNEHVRVGHPTTSGRTTLIHALIYKNEYMHTSYSTNPDTNWPWYNKPPPDAKTRMALAEVILSDKRFNLNEPAWYSACQSDCKKKITALQFALDMKDREMIQLLLRCPKIDTTGITESELSEYRSK